MPRWPELGQQRRTTQPCLAGIGQNQYVSTRQRSEHFLPVPGIVDRSSDQNRSAALQDFCACNGVSRRLSTMTPQGLTGSLDIAHRRGSDHRRAPCRSRSESRKPVPASDDRHAALPAPVIHWLRPLFSAVLPSRLAAAFRRNHGRPRVHARDKTNVQFARFVFQQATGCQQYPPPCKQRQPAPGDQRDWGRCIAATTRLTPGQQSGLRHKAGYGRDDCRARASHRQWRHAPVRQPARKRMDFGMRLTGFFVPALADDLTGHRAAAHSRRGGWAKSSTDHARRAAARAPSCRGSTAVEISLLLAGASRGETSRMALEKASTSSKLR